MGGKSKMSYIEFDEIEKIALGNLIFKENLLELVKNLNERQLMVLYLLSLDLKENDIAEILKISQSTVNLERQEIKRKFKEIQKQEAENEN